jgi:hypothetical protein
MFSSRSDWWERKQEMMYAIKAEKTDRIVDTLVRGGLGKGKSSEVSMQGGGSKVKHSNGYQ